MTKTKPTHGLKPGDLICGTCGEGNVPTRKFCSRCGESLIEAVHVRAAWWRRFIPRRGPKVVALGKSAGGGTGKAAAEHRDIKFLVRRIYRKARIVVALCVVAGGALYGAYPPLRDAVNRHVTSLKNSVLQVADTTLVPIHPVSVTANAQSTGHPAALATDELTNTYWLAPWAASPEPTLTLTFSHPVTLKKLILHSGASDAYIADGRPSLLHLVFSNQESFSITPQDTAQPQTFTIDHAALVTSVEFQVPSTYQGTGSPNVAITEIELFGFQ